MTEILDKFGSIWFYWMFASFALGVIGFLFLFYTQYCNPKEKKKTLKIGLILFVQVFITWIIGFGNLVLITSNARHEIKEFIGAPLEPVVLNGIQMDREQSSEIIEELNEIQNLLAHHSHPTTKNEVLLKSLTGDTLVLSLERDSEIKDEFWVFLKKYRATSANEIGRIRSERLDTLLN